MEMRSTTPLATSRRRKKNARPPSDKTVSHSTSSLIVDNLQFFLNSIVLIIDGIIFREMGCKNKDYRHPLLFLDSPLYLIYMKKYFGNCSAKTMITLFVVDVVAVGQSLLPSFWTCLYSPPRKYLSGDRK